MKLFSVFLAAALSLAAAPANWTATVRQMPSGAMVMGNPAAKVQLVEYLSFSCSHCAAFTAEASAPLKRDYVSKGIASVEVRNAVRDRFDFAAALLARCGGPARFFGNTEALMAGQESWMAKAGAFQEANMAAMAKMSVSDSVKLIAHGVGLDSIMKTRGLTNAQMDACLINKTAQNKIVAMTNEAWNIRKINGTPAFLVNGTALEGAGHWAIVEGSLKTAAGL